MFELYYMKFYVHCNLKTNIIWLNDSNLLTGSLLVLVWLEQGDSVSQVFNASGGDAGIEGIQSEWWGGG